MCSPSKTLYCASARKCLNPQHNSITTRDAKFVGASSLTHIFLTSPTHTSVLKIADYFFPCISLVDSLSFPLRGQTQKVCPSCFDHCWLKWKPKAKTSNAIQGHYPKRARVKAILMPVDKCHCMSKSAWINKFLWLKTKDKRCLFMDTSQKSTVDMCTLHICP